MASTGFGGPTRPPGGMLAQPPQGMPPGVGMPRQPLNEQVAQMSLRNGVSSSPPLVNLSADPLASAILSSVSRAAKIPVLCRGRPACRDRQHLVSLHTALGRLQMDQAHCKPQCHSSSNLHARRTCSRGCSNRCLGHHVWRPPAEGLPGQAACYRGRQAPMAMLLDCGHRRRRCSRLAWQSPGPRRCQEAVAWPLPVQSWGLCAPSASGHLGHLCLCHPHRQA